MEGILSKKSGRVKGLHSWHARFFEAKAGSKTLRYWPDAESRAKGRPSKDLHLLDFMCYQPKMGADSAKSQLRFIAVAACLTTDDGGGAIGLQERKVALKAQNPASFQIWLPLVALFHPDEPSQVASSPRVTDKHLLKVFFPDNQGGHCTFKMGPVTTGLEVKEFVLHTMQKGSATALDPKDFLLVDGDHPLGDDALVEKLFVGDLPRVLSMRRASNTEHLTLRIADSRDSMKIPKKGSQQSEHKNSLQDGRASDSTRSSDFKRDFPGHEIRNLQVRESELRLAISQAQLQQTRIMNTWREMQSFLRKEQTTEEATEKDLDREIDRISKLLNINQLDLENTLFLEDVSTGGSSSQGSRESRDSEVHPLLQSNPFSADVNSSNVEEVDLS